MSTSAEPQSDSKKNQQANVSLIFGVVSIILALLNFGSLTCRSLSWVGATVGLLALLAGVRELRAARELDAQGRKLAISGMVTGSIGMVVASFYWPYAFGSLAEYLAISLGCLVLLVIAAAIIRGIRSELVRLVPKCPKCKRSFPGIKKIESEIIPGTEFERLDVDNIRRRYVQYKVICECQMCGARWRRTETRLA